MAMFVWTFSGVMDAIGLGLLLLLFALAGVVVVWGKILNWQERRKRNASGEGREGA